MTKAAGSWILSWITLSRGTAESAIALEYSGQSADCSTVGRRDCIATARSIGFDESFANQQFIYEPGMAPR